MKSNRVSNNHSKHSNNNNNNRENNTQNKKKSNQSKRKQSSSLYYNHSSAPQNTNTRKPSQLITPTGSNKSLTCTTSKQLKSDNVQPLMTTCSITDKEIIEIHKFDPITLCGPFKFDSLKFKFNDNTFQRFTDNPDLNLLYKIEDNDDFNKFNQPDNYDYAKFKIINQLYDYLETLPDLVDTSLSNSSSSTSLTSDSIDTKVNHSIYLNDKDSIGDDNDNINYEFFSSRITLKEDHLDGGIDGIITNNNSSTQLNLDFSMSNSLEPPSYQLNQSGDYYYNSDFEDDVSEIENDYNHSNVLYMSPKKLNPDNSPTSNQLPKLPNQTNSIPSA